MLEWPSDQFFWNWCTCIRNPLYYVLSRWLFQITIFLFFSLCVSNLPNSLIILFWFVPAYLSWLQQVITTRKINIKFVLTSLSTNAVLRDLWIGVKSKMILWLMSSSSGPQIFRTLSFIILVFIQPFFITITQIVSGLTNFELFLMALSIHKM